MSALALAPGWLPGGPGFLSGFLALWLGLALHRVSGALNYEPSMRLGGISFGLMYQSDFLLYIETPGRP